MSYNSDFWTYGAEHEFGDWNRDVPLPEGCNLNFDDNTCVSSNGIANDPKGKLFKFGEEINTDPTDTIEDQGYILARIARSTDAVANYRSNLHLHIHVPGLKDDLESLKMLLTYVHTHAEEAFRLVEPIPVPSKNQPAEHYEWEMKRYKRRQKSHQHRINQKQYDRMMAAETVQEFFEAECHKDAKGNPAWFQVPRAGINIRQIWEHSETIEFRHFPGTLDPKELYSAFLWVKNFMFAALNDHNLTPMDIYEQREWDFPTFPEYDFYQEQVYQYTNFDKNGRKVVEERLNALREQIDIDDVTVSAKDVYDLIPREEDDAGVLPV